MAQPHRAGIKSVFVRRLFEFPTPFGAENSESYDYKKVQMSQVILGDVFVADNGKKLGFGIIGCGVIADFHANALFELSGDADLLGVADVNYDAAEKFANRHRIRPYPDVPALLADKAVDVVCICTPSGYHADVVRQAAEAGKHIVVEKPMAITKAQLDDIVACCETNGVMLTSIAQSRFSRSVVRTKNAVDEGLLGRIVTADIYMKYFRSQEYYDSGSWRGTKRLDGGGALMNQGIHGVDLLLHLAGPVSRVYARAKTLARKIEVEDTLSAVVDFESGAIGVIQATTSVYPGYPRRLEINGEKGSIALEENSIAKWDIYSGSHEDIVVQPAAFSSASTPTAISLDGHTRQIADMIRAVKTGTRPTIDVYEGRKPVDLILAIYRSAEEGRPIDL